MPERAEIEAVARAIRDFAPMCDSVSAAERAVAALDRVRDARDDDALDHHQKWLDEHAQPRNPDCIECRALNARDAARSPQGEDHEAGIKAYRESVASGHSEEHAIIAAIRASRDGTVAVEQPEPDALGGLPPSQPKEDQ